MKVDQRGRICLPKSLRERLGILAKSDVDFELIRGEIVVRKRDEPRDPNSQRKLSAAISRLQRQR